MNKKILLGVVGIGLAVFGVYVAFCPSQRIIKKDIATTPVVVDGARSEKDATYKINGMSVTLKNGVAEMEAAPGSASKIITRYFGNEVRHDFDGDGSQDVAFLVTQETGGSGTFFYLVAALNKPTGYIGSADAVLLGDRVAPQPTNMGKGNIIVVNYAERAPGEPFTTQPSIGKSGWYLLDPVSMQFGVVEQNFSGEADPARMTLGMQKWHWIKTTHADGTETKPRDPERFVITFGSESFSATTDCNNVGGPYTAKGDTLVFGAGMISTMMACMDSQEGEFTGSLQSVNKYHFTNRGELILEMTNKGSITFK